MSIVSILRSAESMTHHLLLQNEEHISYGKILIQRNEKSKLKEPILIYKKLPNLDGKIVFLVDCMLATGQSMIKAINTILENNVNIENIRLVNMICAPEGLNNVG